MFYPFRKDNFGHRYWSSLMPQCPKISVFAVLARASHLYFVVITCDKNCVTLSSVVTGLAWQGPASSWLWDPTGDEQKIRDKCGVSSRELPLGIRAPGSHRDKYQAGKWSPLTRLFWYHHDDFVYQCQYYLYQKSVQPPSSVSSKRIRGRDKLFLSRDKHQQESDPFFDTTLLNIIYTTRSQNDGFCLLLCWLGRLEKTSSMQT